MRQSRPDVLALIPARGGSKGIPRKNVMLIRGQPLIRYTILHALQSHRITRVVVSTDDEEIAQVARANGAEVPFMRPIEFAGDSSPDIDAFRHALQWLQDKEGYVPHVVVHLRPTGPVRRVELIDQAIDLMLSHSEADSLRSVSVAQQSPYKMWRIEEGYLKPLLTIEGVTGSCSMPRQLLPRVYWQNGYVDVVRPSTVLEKGSMTGDIVLPFIITDPIFELDSPDDIPEVEDALQRFEMGESIGHTAQGTERYPV